MRPQHNNPKLVDLHVNGLTVPARGEFAHEVVNFSSPQLSLDQVRLATEILVQKGTSSFLATLVTSDPESTIRNVRLIAQAMRETWGEPILGIHLEGPFFSKECKGAHPEQFIREKGDIGLFRTFFEAADGAVVLTTISPAIREAASFIGAVADLGVVVSIGHHNADVKQIEEAFAAGATGVTHAGNAWSKEPASDARKNMEVAAQLLNPNAFVMVIPDGVHVDETFIKYAYRMVEWSVPGRIVWVSDASPFSGAPEGTYKGFCDETVLVGRDENQRLRTFPLTGSYLQLGECLDVLRGMRVVPEVDVIAGAASNPLSFVEPALKRLSRYPDLTSLG